MIDFEFKNITESQWFKLIQNNKELTTNEFVSNIKEKSNLNIIIQSGYKTNDVGIYGIIKNVGLYGFLKPKNNFFIYGTTEIKLENNNDIFTFILDETQTLNDFCEYLDLFFAKNNISFQKTIKIYFYEQLHELLNINKK